MTMLACPFGRSFADNLPAAEGPWVNTHPLHLQDPDKHAEHLLTYVWIACWADYVNRSHGHVLDFREIVEAMEAMEELDEAGATTEGLRLAAAHTGFASTLLAALDGWTTARSDVDVIDHLGRVMYTLWLTCHDENGEMDLDGLIAFVEAHEAADRVAGNADAWDAAFQLAYAG